MTILNRNLENQKIKSVSGSMIVTNLYTAGIGGELFLRALKDNQEILGSHCSKCKKSFIPARLFCERCLSRLTQHKPAPREGVLQSFTTVHIDLDGKTLSEPELFGFITFKGFEGGMIHRLRSNSNLKIGTKVKPVFASDRKGSINDISYFTAA